MADEENTSKVTRDGETTEEESPGREVFSSGDLAPENEGSLVIVEGQIPEDGASHELTTEERTNREGERGRGEESRDEGFEDTATDNTEEGDPAGSKGKLGRDGKTPGAGDGESREGSVVNANAGAEQSDDGEKSMETSMEIIEMNEAKDEAEVISLETLPTSDDAKVKGIQTQLIETIMLLQVINTLAMVGRYLRITTNATADDASLLISQQGTLFETLKLCDTLSLMMQSFQSGANNILEKLKIAYLYLLDGFPDFAITDIGAIAKDVDTMKKAVEKTQKKVTEMRKTAQEMKPKVEDALKDRQSKLKSAEEEHAMAMKGCSEKDPQPPKASQKHGVVQLIGYVLQKAVACFVFIWHVIPAVFGAVVRNAVAFTTFIGLGITRKLRLLKVLRYLTSFKVVVGILEIEIRVVTNFPIWFFRSKCLGVLLWLKEGIPDKVPSNEAVIHAILAFFRIESEVKEGNLGGGGTEMEPQPAKPTKKHVLIRLMQFVVRRAVACSVFIGLGITRKLQLLAVLRYVTSFKVVVWILEIEIRVVTNFPIWFFRSKCLGVLVWLKEGIPDEVPSNGAVIHAILAFLRIESEVKEENLGRGGTETEPQPAKPTKKHVLIRLMQFVVRRAVACSVFIGLGITRKLQLLEVLRYVTSFKVVVWILEVEIRVVTYFPIRFFRSKCLNVLVWLKEGIPEEVPSNEAAIRAILAFLGIESEVKAETEVTFCSSKARSSSGEGSSLRRRRNLDSANIESGPKITTSKPASEIVVDTAKIRSLEYDIQKYKEVVNRLKLVLTIVEQTDPLLKSVEAILRRSTDLVEKWYKECADIVEPSMAMTVKAAEKLGEEEKMKYWTSMQFQQEAVTYYCRWRALQVYSETSRSNLRQVRKDVEGYYTENLLPREAVKFSWELARKESDPLIQEICRQHQDDQ